MNFSEKEIKINDIKAERKQYGKNGNTDYSKILLNIGRASRVAPNHIVASITERSLLHGSDIGKIEIYDDHSVVSVPSVSVDEVLDMMYGAKVCGRPVKASLYEEPQRRNNQQRKDHRSRKKTENDSRHRLKDKKSNNKKPSKKAAKRHG